MAAAGFGLHDLWGPLPVLFSSGLSPSLTLASPAQPGQNTDLDLDSRLMTLLLNKPRATAMNRRFQDAADNCSPCRSRGDVERWPGVSNDRQRDVRAAMSQRTVEFVN